MSSPRVIVAAVVGSLSCALLLVIAAGCVCKVYHMRVYQHRGGPQHETPLSRQLAEMFHHRAPPPPYHEAMLTSRPFDEAYLELLGHTEHHLEASGVASDQNANLAPPRERSHRSNPQGSRRYQCNQPHQNQFQMTTETGRLVDVEPLPVLLEVLEDGPQQQGTSPVVPASAQPPPYSEGVPSVSTEPYCCDSEDESSEIGTWRGGFENTSYVDDENTRASVQPAIQQEMIPSTDIRTTDIVSLSSSLCVRNSRGVRGNAERNTDDPNEEDGSDKDAENASTSLSVESPRMTVGEENVIKQQNDSDDDDDTDSDCILDGNNVEESDGDDTDSDTACILGHT